MKVISINKNNAPTTDNKEDSLGHKFRIIPTEFSPLASLLLFPHLLLLL